MIHIQYVFVSFDFMAVSKLEIGIHCSTTMFEKIHGDLQTNQIFSTVFTLGEVLDILDNFASSVMFRNFQETEWVISGWTADRNHNVAVGFDDCPWETNGS